MSSRYTHVLSVLTTVVVSLVNRLYDDAAHTWPRRDDNRPRATRRDSLDLVRIQRSSDGNGAGECQEGASAYFPPPSYKSSAIPHSSHVLPSIPMRKREMNKLGLTVVTSPTVFPVRT